MDKPSIDSLLDNVPGMYELASIAAKRAIAIKKKNRETTQPLQQALEEICEGDVDFDYRSVDSKDAQKGEQIELPLEIDSERAKLRDSAVLSDSEVDQSDDDVSSENDQDDLEEVDIDIDMDVNNLDDEITPKIYKDNDYSEDDEEDI